jgi:hypothetical protein
MKIAITDACIFIDLIELEIISEFFQLKIELHTTIDVLNELYMEQKQILLAYQSGNQLTVHNLGPDDVANIASAPFPRGLSQEDKTVLYLANLLENAMVLSSDKLVRDFAGKRSIEYHGIFWIFDKLIEERVITKETGVSKLKKLLKMNIMYQGTTTRHETEKRIQSWTNN